MTEGGVSDSGVSPVVRKGRDQTVHERRVEFLDTLAILVGCEGTLGGELPDGRRPDVIRYTPERRVLFIGDAKHWESPGNRETQARLLSYVRWMSAHVQSGGVGVFAMCFGRQSDTAAWVETMEMLSYEERLYCEAKGVEEFEPRLYVVWFRFGTPCAEPRP